jgi:hypothetical protein
MSTEKWYPGKILKERRKSSTTGSSGVKDEGMDTSSSSQNAGPSPIPSPASSPSPAGATITPSFVPPSANTNPPTTELSPESKPKSIQRETSIDPPKKSSSAQEIQKPKEKRSSSSSKDSSPWYPGKAFGRKPPSWATPASTNFASRRPSMPIGGSAPVQIVGNVIIKVLGAKYMSATRPNFEVSPLLAFSSYSCRCGLVPKLKPFITSH